MAYDEKSTSTGHFEGHRPSISEIYSTIASLSTNQEHTTSEVTKTSSSTSIKSSITRINQCGEPNTIFTFKNNLKRKSSQRGAPTFNHTELQYTDEHKSINQQNLKNVSNHNIGYRRFPPIHRPTNYHLTNIMNILNIIMPQYSQYIHIAGSRS